MLILVCGSRDWGDRLTIAGELSKLSDGATIIHGGARGADSLAGQEAAKLGFQVLEVKPQWERYGRSAGFRRNIEMLEMKPSLVIAFHKSGSAGTAHTIVEAEKRGIPVTVIDVTPPANGEAQ